MDHVGVICRKAVRDRGDRSHGAGNSDERERLAERHFARRLGDGGPNIGDRGRDLRLGRRVGAQVPLGHADASDIHAVRSQ